jgi:AraC-like DNA-binding protein
VVFDTRSVPDAQRLASWSEQSARAFFPMSIRPLVRRPFSARLDAHQLGSVRIARVSGDPNVCIRTRRDIASGDPELLRVLLLRHGSTRVEQDGRWCVLGDGDMTIYDSSRPFAVHARRPFDLLVCGLPLAALRWDADRMLALAAERLPAHAAVPRMFAAFVGDLALAARGGELADAELELAETVVSFCRALAHHDRDRLGALARPSARRIKAYIDANLGDPALGPATIAAAHHVSVRYVHRLFEPEGVTVSAWIRARRLDGCRGDLLDPALAEQPVSLIARRWGWTDAARFSRRFREAYGCTPSEVRAAASRARSGA